MVWQPATCFGLALCCALAMGIIWPGASFVSLHAACVAVQARPAACVRAECHSVRTHAYMCTHCAIHVHTRCHTGMQVRSIRWNCRAGQGSEVHGMHTHTPPCTYSVALVWRALTQPWPMPVRVLMRAFSTCM